MPEQLRIIDALGPFHKQASQNTTNWSKVVFSELEENGELARKTQARIVANFDAYLSHVAVLGYNAISVDDLAHLIAFPFYDDALRTRIEQYRQLYGQLFATASRHGMRIFINTDYTFRNASIDRHLAKTKLSTASFFASAVQQALLDFPAIDGVIMRIGENDGVDVAGDFLSSLTLRTPRQANRLLRQLLPLFEAHDKTLVFRTWTVGAHRIGDLIWNERTFDAVFRHIDSQNLIISMKFGDTDFMRHLGLNPHFLRGNHRKLLELQARREWEGMGTYPSFVGWDHARYFKQLTGAANIAGIHVWCQTGGWAKHTWSNITFMDGGAFWNELNAFVTVRLYLLRESVSDAIAAFCKQYHITDGARFTELLRLNDRAIQEGLYIQEFARRSLYFRRTRIPPLFWLAWDRVLVNTPVSYVLQTYVTRPAQAIREGYQAVDDLDAMIAIGEEIKLPRFAIDSLRFQRETFSLLAQLREHLLSPGLDKKKRQALQKQLVKYSQTHAHHYTISESALDAQSSAPSPAVRMLIRLLLRDKAAYRLIDRIILLTSPAQRIIARRFFKKSDPQLLKQSMGIETIFK